jgi:hypothetical protein
LFLLVAVILGMRLRGFIGVMLGVSGMARRDLRVMGALFDRSRFMMFGGFLVMLSGLFVMLGGLGVVFRNLGCCNGHLLVSFSSRPTIGHRLIMEPAYDAKVTFIETRERCEDARPRDDRFHAVHLNAA